MNRNEIDALLSKQNDEVVEAHKEIIALQKGEGHIIKTGTEHLDYFLVGGLNNKMVFIGSRPSQGKSFSCETLINNLLDISLNPDPNISILRMNLEMQTKSLLLRDLKKTLNRKMIDIISKPYSDEDRVVVTNVVNKLRDSRIINFSKALTGEDLKYLLKKFCQNANEKDLENGTTTQKIVLIDHLHIYNSKKDIDEVLSICNEMKMEDKDLSFVIYFQFNRSLEDVWRDSKDKKANPKTFLPNSSHIYNTDTLMQYADIVIGMVIPQVVDMEEFVSVYKDRSMHLKDHFIDDSSDNVTVRLKGRNRIYYNYIKIRLIDDWEDPRLYCALLNPDYEETANKLYEQEKVTKLAPPVFNAASSTNTTFPSFNSPGIQSARDASFENESPF